MDKVIENDYIDTFRHFHKNKVQYTYWYFAFDARKRNVGWRIDYVLVTKNLLNKVKKAFILDKVLGSDHCPISIELKI